MPLITCPDCDRQVSTRATHCPGCGSPVAPQTSQTKNPSEPAPANRTSEPRRRTQGEAQRFFSAGQIRAAAFFGSILCAAHLIASNWRRLGRPDAGSTAWLLSLALFAAVFVVGLLIPEKAATQAGLASTLLYIAMADRLYKRQSEAVATQLTQGAATASNWVVAAISLTYGVAFIALVLGLSLLS